MTMADDTILRKDIRSLSLNEKQKFVDAVKALKANTKDNKLADNRYNDYVLWHAQTMMIDAGNDGMALILVRKKHDLEYP